MSQTDNRLNSNYDTFLKLRQSAIEISPERLGLDLSSASNEPFGVVMDINLSTGFASVVSFVTGDASLYTNTGGGVIGGIGHDNIRSAAQKFVRVSSDYIDKMAANATFQFPKSGNVKFYILTQKGVFSCESSEEELLHNEFSPLYAAGQRVISEMFAVSKGYHYKKKIVIFYFVSKIKSFLARFFHK